jgi:arginyl-tRNA synthetase
MSRQSLVYNSIQCLNKLPRSTLHLSGEEQSFGDASPETELNHLILSPSRFFYRAKTQGELPTTPQTEDFQGSALYIQTRRFGDSHDRILQHHDGEYSALCEDLAKYHHILQQENCDRLIVLQSHEYKSYRIQVEAAMQCIGYRPEQFHYISIQPLKLYAFHKETNKIQPIPDLPASELQKVVNPETLRWYSLRVPLDEIAPLNLSTSSPDHSQNHFYRVQLAYAYAQKYLKLLKAHHLDTSNSSISASENPEEHTLVNTLQSTQTVVNRAIDEVAPHLICQHAEQISEQCLQWLPPQQWLPSSYNTLQQVRDVLSDLVEVKLGLTLNSHSGET